MPGDPRDLTVPQTYLRFLNLTSAIRGLPDILALDPVEERLLNGLARLLGTGEEVTVLQAMKGAGDSSPSTVHRRLKALHSKGLISYAEKPSDQRTKHIELTPFAEQYFAELSRCINQAARG
jgi:DNA-binding MarR family transcriptional regulator